MNTTFSNKLYGGGKTYQVYNFDKKRINILEKKYGKTQEQQKKKRK